MEEDKSCPICFEEYSRENFILKDGNLNHTFDSNSKCIHWFCVSCLENMFLSRIFNCPICRDDITDLVYSHQKYHQYHYISDEEIIEEEESESEEENEQDNYETQIRTPIIIDYNDENENSDFDS